MKRWIAWMLALLMLAGCAASGAQRGPATETTMDFAVNLFREAAEPGENTLVSPLSVLTALAMAANGMEGETLAQVETVLGGTREALNCWLKNFTSDGVQKLANGIWVKEDANFRPQQDFLDVVQKTYDAQIQTAPFDASTRDEINSWVNEKTDGMIDEIVDEIPTEAVLYLVNALAFDADWANPYAEDQVRKETFTTEDGEAQCVDMMFDTVHNYLRMEGATGFLKWYEGQKYAFVALLPDAGVPVAALLDSLTGEQLAQLLENPESTPVKTAIPRFEAEGEADLKEVLGKLGMVHAFDEDRADLSAMGMYENAGLYISRVLHKTYMEVAEQGTRAGAATAVEVAYATGAVGPQEEPVTVYLDRPFVYMIVDMEHSYPIFMGTYMEATENELLPVKWTVK